MSDFCQLHLGCDEIVVSMDDNIGTNLAQALREILGNCGNFQAKKGGPKGPLFIGKYMVPER